MSEVLPQFPYYADPVGDGRIVQQDIVCDVCEKPRNWAYVGSLYVPGGKPEFLCPWCVADGSAAAKFQGGFQDADFSENASAESVAAVMRQTPRVVIWNPIFWPDHCDECCTYFGEFIPSEQPELALRTDVLAEAQAIARGISEKWGAEDVLDCGERGSITLHLFQCRQCGTHKLSPDGT
ncbi:CbrC family protein [Deinococcus sp. AJ005]|uniref:CbrC family protein n=1 Tax=Deinococcus sp. AJ005 TaxID=2652443 RepID=UPI00125CAFD6|nr:CbrC family protein [Deinococcus sp. AJ005]QFP75173.1 CbrC family protein [Deinococcus sp. AJ005]